MTSLPGDDTVLGKILADKRKHIAECKQSMPESELDKRLSYHMAEKPAGAFVQALRTGIDTRGYGVIAEIKKASPSKGVLRDPFDAGAIAASYAANGADAISVLTDTPYFQGKDSDLTAALKGAPATPLLRKDFMLEPYQVKEAALAGASCVLLILAALTDAQALSLQACAKEYGLNVLAEVHDAEELQRALCIPDITLLGINNRNLKTLNVTLATFEALAPHVPDHMIAVCESGIASKDDIKRMRSAGAAAFLIGERFMAAEHPGEALAAFL